MSRPLGTPAELHRRRQLAVRRVVEDGHSAAAVGRMLGVDPRTVRGWVTAHERQGPAALEPRPRPAGRSRLSPQQEQEMLGWFTRPATAQGFPTDLWTAPRVSALLQKRFGVSYHPRYLNAFLKARGITPQKPRKVPREKDPRAIAAWKETRWETVKKKPGRSRPIW